MAINYAMKNLSVQQTQNSLSFHVTFLALHVQNSLIFSVQFFSSLSHIVLFGNIRQV